MIRVRTGGLVHGMENLKRFAKAKLGDTVLTDVPKDDGEALAIAKFCKDSGLHFFLAEVRRRRDYTSGEKPNPADRISAPGLRRVVKAGGKYYLGRIILGEAGGMAYWPKEYLVGKTSEGEFKNIPPARDLAEAKAHYLQVLRRGVKMERKLGGGPLWDVDSSMLFRDHLEAGVDVPNLEMLPGDSNLMFAALRGAARAHGRRLFCSHIAMTWYGGAVWDELFYKRWKMALYFSYMAGAGVIVSEAGHIGSKGYGHDYGFAAPQTKRFRRILREFGEFCRGNPRPTHGPRVRIGFVHGHLDGYPGLWSKWVWGQFGGRAWQHDAPEWGWDLLPALYRKDEWFSNTNIGTVDQSGAVPGGLYDIVPMEAPQKVLNRYSCLILLGWNTMTEPAYAALKAYVRQGGHLVMALPHLGVNVKRGEALRLFRGGDFRDLFGVEVEGQAKRRVTGVKFAGTSSLPGYRFPDWTAMSDPKCTNRGFAAGKVKLSSAKVLAVAAHNFSPDKESVPPLPVLLENGLGRGKAFLVNSWYYPGHRDVSAFMQEVLKTVLRGEQDTDPIILASDRVRHAVYEENGRHTLYLLNTDFDLRTECRVQWSGRTRSILLRPAEFKVVAQP